MFAKRFFRITAWTLGSLALLILAGVLWLRQSPCRAGITLFAEDTRVGNFRDMARVFPSRPVARAGPVWAQVPGRRIARPLHAERRGHQGSESFCAIPRTIGVARIR